MGRYVADLRGGLDAAGVAAPLTVLQSSGGTMTADDAAARPVYALESGPAAGVVAALSLAQQLGHENAIAFDLGGTTAKASLIQDGRVSLSQEYEVGAALSAGSRLLRGSRRADPHPDDRHRRGRRRRRLDRLARRGRRPARRAAQRGRRRPGRPATGSAAPSRP